MIYFILIIGAAAAAVLKNHYIFDAAVALCLIVLHAQGLWLHNHIHSRGDDDDDDHEDKPNWRPRT